MDRLQVPHWQNGAELWLQEEGGRGGKSGKRGFRESKEIERDWKRGVRRAQVPLQSKWSILSFLLCVRGCPRRWWWLCQRQARRLPLWPRLSSTCLRKWRRKKNQNNNKALSVRNQTAGSLAWLLEPEARSTCEGIMDNAPYSWRKDDKQGREYSGVCVCVFNLGFFTVAAVPSANTFSSKYLAAAPSFYQKTLKTLTLFITAVFCHAELFAYQRLVIQTAGANKDGWRINALSCCTATKPRRQPPPSWADKTVCGWSLSGGQDHLSRFVCTAVHSNVNWAQLWISMLNLIFSPSSISC